MTERPLTEAQFQGWVVDVFQRHGWLVKHAGVPARPVGGGRLVPDRRGAGTLDLLLVHRDPPRLMLAEVKAAGGTMTAEQRELVDALRPLVQELADRLDPDPSPVSVHLFRPGSEGLIEELARGRPR